MSKHSTVSRPPSPCRSDSVPLLYGEDAFAMVNRHHEEFMALRRKALAEQQQRQDPS